jgi:hypothetical protein
MFLLSTLRHFANDLVDPREHVEYVAAVASLTVETLALEERDKMNTVLGSQRELEAVSEESLVREGLGKYIDAIRSRAFMITPVGEWGAFANLQNKRGFPERKTA